jgi:DNA-binding GntR family transcriptional regulator
VSALSIESRRRTARKQTTRQRALSDHEAMVKAIRSRDAKSAEKLMVAHLQHVLSSLKGPRA